jgi:hypothetical protein
VNNVQGAPVLGTGMQDRRVVDIGQQVIWRSRAVEVIDLVTLDPGWCQVLVRFTDDLSRPPVSMPYRELVEGLIL